MPSVLVSSGADLLLFGMSERQILETANRLKHEDIREITDIKGTCYLTAPANSPLGFAQAASFEQVCENKREYAKACRVQCENQEKGVLQRHGAEMLVQNPAQPPLTQEEMDRVYALPYMRTYHPSYEAEGGVPASEEVEFSVTHNRGCFGACNFCAITLHQGKGVTCRSKESVLREVEELTKKSSFKGYIHDIGGPTANFRRNPCEKESFCKNKKCLAPEKCPSLSADHSEYLDILRCVRKTAGVKKVFIRSGIRYDYLLYDKNSAFLRELVEHHVSGQLKVAPEHCVNTVLDRMGKPHIEMYRQFSARFYEITKSIGKEQYLVPYLISSHPGSTLADALKLAEYLKANKIRPEQVQDFYPTPGTISTCMYYTGLDPYTLEEVFVPRTAEEKAMQRALLQYWKPENAELVKRAEKLARSAGKGKDNAKKESNNRKSESKGNKGSKDGKAGKKKN